MDEREPFRRWLVGRRAAQDRERETLRDAPPSAGAAWAGALDLIAWASARLGWPLPEDPCTLREEHEARCAWRLLRERWRA